MKRILSIAIAAAVAAMGAQELKLGTMEGTLRYAPVVAKALKEAGFTMKAKGYATQAALLKALGKGDIDGGFFIPQPVIQTVPGAVMVPVKLGESRFDAVTTDPKIKINSSIDLKNYKVGIVRDHSGHMAVTRGMSVTAAPDDYEEFRLLVDGRVQVIIVLEEIIPILAKPAELNNYYTSIPLLRTPNFLALSAAKGGEAAKIETVLRKWVESKQWDEEMGKIDAPPPKK
jgi:ABC-type amino acid transport substrate-binding protein